MAFWKWDLQREGFADKAQQRAVADVLLGNSTMRQVVDNGRLDDCIVWPWSELPEPEQELLNNTFSQVCKPDGTLLHSCAFTFERSDGNIRRFSVCISPPSENKLVTGTIQDITESWLHSEGLKRSIERLELVANTVIDGWCVYDTLCHVMSEISATLPAMFEKESLTGCNLLGELVVPGDASTVLDMLTKATQSEQHILKTELRLKGAKQVVFPAEVSVQSLPDEPTMVLMTFRACALDKKLDQASSSSDSDANLPKLQRTDSRNSSGENSNASQCSGEGLSQQMQVHELLMASFQDQLDDLDGCYCSTDPTKLPQGWLVLPPPLCSLLQPAVKLAALDMLPQQAAAWLERGEWMSLATRSLKVLANAMRSSRTGSFSMPPSSCGSVSTRPSRLPSISEDLESGEGELGRPPTSMLHLHSIDIHSIFAMTFFHVHSVVKMVEEQSKHRQQGKAPSLLQASAPSDGNEMLGKSKNAQSPQAKINSGATLLAKTVTTLSQIKAEGLQRSFKEGAHCTPKDLAFRRGAIKMLFAHSAHALVWCAVHAPQAIPHQHISTARDGALDYLLRYDLKTQAYGCLLRYVQYLVACGHISQACTELGQLRQQLTQKCAGQSASLMLPAALYNLAVVTRASDSSRLGANKNQISSVIAQIESASLKRLRELPLPVPKWVDELRTELARREAGGSGTSPEASGNPGVTEP